MSYIVCQWQRCLALDFLLPIAAHDPQWRRYNWVAVSGLKGFLCPKSWVEPLSVTLDSECHVKACGLIVLAWQKVEISEDLYRDNLHCCFAVQLQWATTCGLDEDWDPYIFEFKLSVFATMWCWAYCLCTIVCYGFAIWNITDAYWIWLMGRFISSLRVNLLSNPITLSL